MESFVAFLEGGLGETILIARRPIGTSGALPDKQHRKKERGQAKRRPCEQTPKNGFPQNDSKEKEEGL